MIEKLKTLDLSLDKLDSIDKDKFSFSAFSHFNNQFENSLKDFSLTIDAKQNTDFSDEEKIFLNKIFTKIEKIETKILHKSELIRSFSKTII